MLQEKRKAEREESKKARVEAKAKARAERQKTKDAKTKEPTVSSPEVTSSTVLAKPDLGIDSLSVASVASVEVVYQQGLAGTGQPYVEYPQLDLDFYALFALGSPIGMFQTVRYESLFHLLAWHIEYSGMMVSLLDLRSPIPGSSPTRGQYVVFLGKTLLSIRLSALA